MAKIDHERRAAFQRRAWRLAVMLSSDPAHAQELFDHLMRELPTIERLDPVRLDRMVIMRAREFEPEIEAAPRTMPPKLPDDPAARALIAARVLPRQAREAWLLRHVDQMEDRDIAKAMDCSVTALLRHLEVAEQHMRDMLGDQFEPAATALRNRIAQRDPMPVIARWEARRRRGRFLRRIVWLILLAALATAAWWAWQRLT